MGWFSSLRVVLAYRVAAKERPFAAGVSGRNK
jgi:hypothetical protein